MDRQSRLAILLLVIRRLAPWLAAIAVYCVIVVRVMERLAVRPEQWATATELANGLILGLLLAFRNRAAYDRWWEGRKLWGQLINDTRNLAWKLRGYLPRTTLRDYRIPAALAGFAEALKRHLRGPVTLQEIGGFEKDAANPAHVPSHLAGWILTSLAAWHREGLIDGSAVLVLDVHARALLDVCGACERIRNTGVSPSYKALLRLGIVLNVLAAPWFTLYEMGYWGIPVLLLVCVFLLGIEQVDSIVEEPFGTELDVLELDHYCRTIEQSVTAILNEEYPSCGESRP
jgi:putative membrane protein